MWHVYACERSASACERVSERSYACWHVLLKAVTAGSFGGAWWHMLQFLGLKFSDFVVLRSYKAPIVSVL